MTGSITQEEFDLLTKMECEIAAELASQGQCQCMLLFAADELNLSHASRSAGQADRGRTRGNSCLGGDTCTCWRAVASAERARDDCSTLIFEAGERRGNMPRVPACTAAAAPQHDCVPLQLCSEHHGEPGECVRWVSMEWYGRFCRARQHGPPGLPPAEETSACPVCLLLHRAHLRRTSRTRCR
jgi:hypothetical protein